MPYPIGVAVFASLPSPACAPCRSSRFRNGFPTSTFPCSKPHWRAALPVGFSHLHPTSPNPPGVDPAAAPGGGEGGWEQTVLWWTPLLRRSLANNPVCRRALSSTSMCSSTRTAITRLRFLLIGHRPTRLLGRRPPRSVAVAAHCPAPATLLRGNRQLRGTVWLLRFRRDARGRFGMVFYEWKRSALSGEYFDLSRARLAVRRTPLPSGSLRSATSSLNLR